MNWLKDKLKRFWGWIISVLGIGAVALALTNSPIPENYDFDVSKKEPPYGAWINVDTGERRYYDIDGKFYDNVEEIEILQIELNTTIRDPEDSIPSNSEETIE